MADDRANDILRLLGVAVDEVEEMERPFAGDSLFKYMPVDRAEFFRKPQIRFTQKDALNDPFELSRRWGEVASTQTRSGMSDYLERTLSEKLNDDEFLMGYAKQEIAKALGGRATAEQISLMEQLIGSEAFRAKRDEIQRGLRSNLSTLISLLFASVTCR